MLTFVSHRSRLAWAVVALLMLGPSPAQADDRHFLIVFGADRPSGRAKYSHSFATFVRALGEGPDVSSYHLETVTISWAPDSAIVKVFRLFPERGRNYALLASLDDAQKERMEVSAWGPFEIEAGLYEKAVLASRELESGAIRYKAADTGYDAGRVQNCIHAISDMVRERGPQLRIGRLSWGASASYFITLTLLPQTIDPRCAHDWILSLLGLDAYPLVRRDLDHNPTKLPILRALQNAAHPQARRNIPGA